MPSGAVKPSSWGLSSKRFMLIKGLVWPRLSYQVVVVTQLRKKLVFPYYLRINRGFGVRTSKLCLVSELAESRFCVCGECELFPGIRWSCGIFEHGTDLNFQLSERMTSGSSSLKDRVTRIEVYLRTPMSDDPLSVAMQLEDFRVKMAEIQKSSEN
ncbi:unnamed protein product [Prunus armeniaca]